MEKKNVVKTILSSIFIFLAAIGTIFSVIGFYSITDYINNMDSAGEALALIFVVLVIGVLYFLGSIVALVFSIITLILSIAGINTYKENKSLGFDSKKPIQFIIFLSLSALMIAWVVVSFLIVVI